MDLKNLDSEVLIQELLDRGYIRVLWHRDDIINVADGLGVFLNDDDISFIMEDIEQNHDANYGLNWEMIKVRVLDVDNNKEK